MTKSAKKFHRRLRLYRNLVELLTEHQLSGPLSHNSAEINETAVHKMVDHYAYWSLGSKALLKRQLSLNQANQIVAQSLGLTVSEFISQQATIEPERTLIQFARAVELLHHWSRQHQTILFATGHPGSMLGAYQELVQYCEAQGAKIYRLTEPVELSNHHFLDDIGGVLAISDEGSLLHTHLAEGMTKLLARETGRPNAIVADHGFAVAGANAGINTIGIYDTDDPAVPSEAFLEPNFVAIPLNDNQKNVYTAQAVRKLLEFFNA